MQDDLSYESLQHQVERIRALISPVLSALLVSPEVTIPAHLTTALLDFHIATKSHASLAQVGETARSLASLLHHSGDQTPSEQERLQITVLIENLLQELMPSTAELPVETRRPLVTPISPSSATVNRRIALYVDSGSLQVMLDETLTQAGFEPVRIDSLEQFAAMEAAQAPAAIIADLSLCQLHPQSANVFANLRRRFSPSPHLFCVAPSDDIPARLEAVRLGATRFLPQPVDTARLIAIIKGVTVQIPARPFRVVMVEDDPFLGEVYRDGLVHAGIEICVVNDPLLAPARIAEFQPDLVVSDLFMPGCNGFELLALLRQDETLADTPIMLLSSEPDVERRLEALDLGADDFLLKPVDMPLLVSTVVARAKRARMLKRSRSEYRRVLERMREMEPYLPDSFPGLPAAEMTFDDLLFTETINMDDYVVGEVAREDLGEFGVSSDFGRDAGRDSRPTPLKPV